MKTESRLIVILFPHFDRCIVLTYDVNIRRILVKYMNVLYYFYKLLKFYFKIKLQKIIQKIMPMLSYS